MQSAKKGAISHDIGKYNGLPMPPRGTGETLASSFQGLVSFLSRESRDTFVDRANKGIIKPTSIGMLSSLALHHELGCPLFDKYNFDIMEFGNGVPGALEYFYNMDDQFHKETIEKILDFDISELTIKSADEVTSNKVNFTTLTHPILHPEKFIAAVMQLTQEIKSYADLNPDSAAAIMMRLLTPLLFQIKCIEMAKGYLIFKFHNIEKEHHIFWNQKVEVNNVTLLSARALAIPPEPATLEELAQMSEQDKQKNDDLINNIYHEYPCIAQIEVLYSRRYQKNETTEPNHNHVKQFEVHNEITLTIRTSAGDINLKDIQSEERNMRVTFVGWLFGSPTKKLDWKIGAIASA